MSDELKVMSEPGVRYAFTTRHSSLITHYFLSLLVDPADQLAADLVAARPAVGHHAARGREDVDAEAAEHARHRRAFDVDAAAGLRHALQPRDHLLALRAIAQVDADVAAHAFADDLEIVDEPFFFQNARDLQLDARDRHVYLLVLG